MKRKKRKAPSRRALLDRADDLFSEFIRLSDADENGTVQCVTCGKLMFWKGDGAHCGHFIKRGKHATRFDRRNCHVQCVRCNCYLGGNDAKYAVYIIDKFGRETHDEVCALGETQRIWRAHDLQELIEKYSPLVDAMKRKFH